MAMRESDMSRHATAWQETANEDSVMGDVGRVTVTLQGVRRELTTPCGRAMPEEHTQQGHGEVGGPGSCRIHVCLLSQGKE